VFVGSNPTLSAKNENALLARAFSFCRGWEVRTHE
jgi:hypothetical protein